VIHAIFLVRRAPTFARFGRFATGIAFGHHPITLQKITKEWGQKSCVQMQMFLILKKLVKIVVSYTQVEGIDKKKNRKSRLVSAALKKKESLKRTNTVFSRG
jgi:hypothetical protein